MHPREIRIEDYNYNLPDERIAKYPLAERDASKLLVYKNDKITEDLYQNIADYIPAESLLVFNETKVVHARLIFKKASGGAIEVFCLSPYEQYADIQTAMLQKGRVLWECLVGGANKWKNDVTIQLTHGQPNFVLSAKIIARNSSSYVLELEWDNEQLTFAEILHYAGKIPLPPYLHREAEDADDTRYQTLFAKEEGSVAAPTAGLHFTERIMDSIAAKNIGMAFVTLHVGAGTFRPVKSATMAEHDMHAEWMEVNKATIENLLNNDNKKIVAVGTTSLRTLESLYWVGQQLTNGQQLNLHGVAVGQWLPYETKASCQRTDAMTAVLQYMTDHDMTKLVTRTQLLIAPGYSFKMVDGLVTNFHQPQSTLLLLVGAFVGNVWRDVYEYAMANDYRFLSYGDGSLLWRQ